MQLLPRSLKGQLLTLLLAGLVISQVASFWFILSDQKVRMKNEWLHNTVQRIATVADAVESTPREFHDKIIKSVSVWALKYSIEPAPSVSPADQARSEPIQAELQRAFPERSDKIQVSIFTLLNQETQLELLFGDFWRDVKRTLFPKSSLIPKPPARPAYAHISIPLKTGEWLNVVVMPRGFAPPASPLMIQFATMAALCAVGLILVLGRLTRPLKELAKAASALGRGEANVRLEEKGPREIVATIRAFNDMQERLSRFVHDRTKMLAALGHDLRTPITSLRLRAEFIEDDETRQKILETLDEMQQMAEATLSFAREEAAHEETRLVDAGALISTVCADLADNGLSVTCADPGSLTLPCRPVGIKRALRNLIENAVAYGQNARVSVEHKAGNVFVIIDDDGPGIPAQEMERVFKPFVRLENSRNRETGGIGLGLSIARSIIRSHGGDIMLQNRPGGGLRAIITLHGATAIESPKDVTFTAEKAAA